MKTFQCRDVGMDCDWSAKSENESDLMSQIAKHGKDKHGITEMSEDLRQKVLSKIRDVKAA